MNACDLAFPMPSHIVLQDDVVTVPVPVQKQLISFG